MSIEQIALAAAAAAVAAWPKIQSLALAWLKKPAPGPTPKPLSSVGYEAAIHDLASVRSRLAATSLLADDQKKAIDTLTLALVAGSDK